MLLKCVQEKFQEKIKEYITPIHRSHFWKHYFVTTAQIESGDITLSFRIPSHFDNDIKNGIKKMVKEPIKKHIKFFSSIEARVKIKPDDDLPENQIVDDTKIFMNTMLEDSEVCDILRKIKTEEEELLELREYKAKMTTKGYTNNPLNKRGVALAKKGKTEQAIKEFKRYIKINETDFISYYNLGQALYNMGRFDEAIATFNKAIEINPKDSSAYYNLGRTYAEKGLYDKAIESYNKAIEINPKYSSDAYNNLGFLLVSKVDFDKAITEFSLAIKYDLKNYHSYYNLGFIYASQGLIDKAIEECQKGIDINTKYLDKKKNQHGQVAVEMKKRVNEAILNFENFLNNATPEDTDRADKVKNIIKILKDQ